MIPALQLLFAKYLIMNQSVLAQMGILVILPFHAHYVGLNWKQGFQRVDIKTIKFRHLALNVQLIQNVQTILHVLEKNVKILASQARVEWMLNVK